MHTTVRTLRALLALVLSLSGLVGLSVGLSVGVGVATAGPASAATCTRLWTGAVSNDWDNRLNWSPNDAPAGGADVACLTGAGTYTVELNSGNNHGVASLVVGGPSAHVTFKLGETANAILFIRDELDVAAGSSVVIGGPHAVGSYLGHGFTGDTATFTNNGTISSYRTVPAGGSVFDQTNGFDIDGVNNGTFVVDSGRLDISENFVNNGTFTVDPDALAWSSGDAGDGFTNNGTVANNGRMYAFNSAWTQNGPVTGNPVEIRSSSFTNLGGTGTFHLQISHFTGGAIRAGQTFLVGGADSGGNELILDTPTTIQPGGRIIANITDGNNYTFSGQTLTNRGSIEVTSPGFHNLEINNSFVNGAEGSFVVHSGRVNARQAFTNAGALSVAPGAQFWKFGTLPFVNQAVIANSGDFYAYSSPWTQQAGGSTGRPIVVIDSDFVDQGGGGRFQFQYVRFSGTVPAGQVIYVGGGSGGQELTLTAPSTVAPGGRIVATIDGNLYRFSGASLTNRGLIEVSSVPGEERQLDLRTTLVNAAGGAIAVHSGRIDLNTDGSLVNHGTLTIDPGAAIALNSDGQKLTNAADGSLVSRIASPTRFGSVITFGAGTVGPLQGTLGGVLTGGYEPAVGTTFDVIRTPYGAGRFGAVTGGFAASYGPNLVSLRVKPAAPTPAAHRTSLAISAPASVRRGKRASIGTTLRDTVTRKPLAGAAVTLYRMAAGSSRWTKVRTVRTSVRGTAGTTVRLTKATRFQWRYAGTAALVRSTSATRRVAVRRG